jgi:pimeloyl-ACP methyl ester carboxylesterase
MNPAGDVSGCRHDERNAMAKARVNGIEIDYEDTGHGRPIVLTHGHLSSRIAWNGQHQALGDRYRVISWDIRGHGQTVSPDDPAQYSLALTIADVHGLLGHLGIERAVIGGLSLGGYISLAFTLAHPEMVEALVICDSGPGYRNDGARVQWNERAFSRAADLEANGLAVLDTRSREVRESLGRQRSAQALAHATRGILAQQGSTVIDGLPSIKVPTLVIVGDLDKPFVGPCEYMSKKIHGARLETIAGAGHSSNLDQPDQFNRILRDFLDTLPGGR